jgi:hypothetical protein
MEKMAKLIFTESRKQVIDDGIYELSDYTGGKVNIDEEAFTFLKFIEDQKVDGLSLEDFYLYDGIPMYFFDRPSLFLELKNIISCFITLLCISDRADGKIFVETDNRVMYFAAEKYFDAECLMIEKYKQKVKGEDANTNGKMFRRLSKGFKSQMLFNSKRHNGRNILVFSHAASLNLIKDSNGNPRYFDTQVGPVMEGLREKYNVLNLQFLNNDALINKTIKYDGEYVPFELFKLYKRALGRNIIRQELAVDNLHLIDKLDFSFMGYDIKSILMEYVFGDIKGKYLSYLREILAAEKYLQSGKINKCVVVGEGDRARCFIVAAKRLGTKTFAVQHGIINETSPAYIINSSHGSLLVPDVSFVWGEKYKRILTANSSAYNDSNVKVVGQVRTDFLLQREYKRQSDNKIKILYATQYFMDILQPATKMLFSALEQFNEEYELIIKLHPADVNFDFYNDMIRKYKIRNARIVKDADLYEVISWSDVIVSVLSTVIGEGALFKKPSICIILPKYNDAGGFVKDGISLSACDENELRGLLKDIKCINSEYMDKINKYIHENFYCLDGNAAKRIIEIIGE